MNTYNLNITYYFDGYIIEKCEINPEDFLDCETEEELNNKIHDYIQCNSEGDWGEVNCNDIYDSDYDIPEEFIQEWKHLKFIN